MSDDHFGLSRLALSAVVRICTGPRFSPGPSTIEDAFGFCEDLLTQPHCQIVEPGERHWEIFKRLCDEADIRGPRVTDAWFAALAIEWGCEWITLDRDFARADAGMMCYMADARSGWPRPFISAALRPGGAAPESTSQIATVVSPD
jgi:predicted nucleic acid-binding protein